MTSLPQIPIQTPDLPPSLDHIPSESRSKPVMNYAEVCRRLVSDQFYRAMAAYDLADESRPRKRTERLGDCRSGAWFVVHSETREVRVRSSHCGLRWCPMCQKLKRKIITENVGNWIKAQKTCRLVTLTFKHSQNTLESQLTSLLEAWRRLRRLKVWKEHMTGGIFFVQITFNPDRQEWHPHLHILTTGSYLAHGTLKVLWAEASRGSSICDIRKAVDPDKCVDYVARYATSAASLTAMPCDRAAECIRACDGRKLAGTFGSARGVRLCWHRPDEPDKWKMLTRFTHAQICSLRDLAYAELWQCWMNNKPLPIEWIPPDEEKDEPPVIASAVEEPIRYLWDLPPSPMNVCFASEAVSE